MKTSYELDCVAVREHGHCTTVKFERNNSSVELWIPEGDPVPALGDVWMFHPQRREQQE